MNRQFSETRLLRLQVFPYVAPQFALECLPMDFFLHRLPPLVLHLLPPLVRHFLRPLIRHLLRPWTPHVSLLPLSVRHH